MIVILREPDSEGLKRPFTDGTLRIVLKKTPPHKKYRIKTCSN